MDPTTLLYLRIMTGLMVVVAVFLVWATFGERRKERALRGGGSFAEATVLRELPITHSNRQFEVKFHLHGTPYQAVVRVLAPLAPGDVVRVRYDPADPRQATVEAPSASAGTQGAWVRTAIYAVIASVLAAGLLITTLVTI